MNIVGVYHKGCIDGTTAAAVLSKKFPDVALYPLTHSYQPSDLVPILERLTSETQVYTLDCALGVREFLERGVSVITLDHHISVHDELLTLAKENSRFTYIFDNNKSGASLSWAYFFPEVHRPWIIDLVEDHDLGRWRLQPDTKYLNNYLAAFVDMPEAVLPLFSGIPDEVKHEGMVVTHFIDLLVEQFSELKPVLMHINGHQVRAYNATTCQSEVGHRLSQETEAAVCLFTVQGDHVRLSFRSSPGQVPSALDLAQAVGGGGHVQASGAKIPLSTFLGLLQA